MNPLKESIVNRFQTALAKGSLVFTETTLHTITDHGIPFQVRLAPSLAKKPTLTKKEPTANPFLPHDPDLFIADYPAHNLLLNKFSIEKYHVLLTTKEFKSQFELLEKDDFKVSFQFMQSCPEYFAFYNGGPLSGASLLHRHVQMLPLRQEMPLEKVLDTLEPLDDEQVYFKIPSFGFAHAFVRFKVSLSNLDQVAEQAHEYLRAKMSTHLPEPSYNLVFTLEWMLIVPRSKECIQEPVKVSVNSVGMVGFILVKSQLELEALMHVQPLNVLKQLGYPSE